MENFILLVREEIARFNDLTPETMQAEIGEYMVWVEELSATGNYIGGDPLEGKGALIQTDKSVAHDGPFIESKEAVTGYILIKANDLEQAIALGKGCPVYNYGGALEVRPIMKY